MKREVLSNCRQNHPALHTTDGATFNSSDSRRSTMSDQTSPQTTVGDVISMSVMSCIEVGAPLARGYVSMRPSGGGPTSFVALASPDGNGNVLVQVSDGSGGILAVDSGIDCVESVWQLWKLEYEIGSSTFSVRVGGVSMSGFDSVTTGDVALGTLANGSNTTGSAYFDAVPEPSTAALLGIGLLVLASRRSAG